MGKAASFLVHLRISPNTLLTESNTHRKCRNRLPTGFGVLGGDPRRATVAERRKHVACSDVSPKMVARDSELHRVASFLARPWPCGLESRPALRPIGQTIRCKLGVAPANHLRRKVVWNPKLADPPRQDPEAALVAAGPHSCRGFPEGLRRGQVEASGDPTCGPSFRGEEIDASF